jgi:hypothetical protein
MLDRGTLQYDTSYYYTITKVEINQEQMKERFVDCIIKAVHCSCTIIDLHLSTKSDVNIIFFSILVDI